MKLHYDKLRKPYKGLGPVRGVLISMCVVLSFFVAGALIFLHNRADNLVVTRVREQAVAYTGLIGQVRKWNAAYGGVYVQKRVGVESNAHLLRLDVVPDVRTEAGWDLTLRNHAIMTRELSELTGKNGETSFRVTGLDPIDPINVPDPFEREALQKFGTGTSEVHRFEREGASPVFRYVTPLRAEYECLECHRGRGYVEGSVIGALSVTVPVAPLVRDMKTSKAMAVGIAIAVIGAIVAVFYGLAWRMARKLDVARSQICALLDTDDLTGLKNRRFIISRLEEEFMRAQRAGVPLSLIIMDIDRFKAVNDNFGHPSGDAVLKKVSDRLRSSLRTFDLFGRLGGEEFLVVTPGIARAQAQKIAERISKSVKCGQVTLAEGVSVGVTLSSGVAEIEPYDTGPHSLLRRADLALLQAKQNGRDRVECS